MQRHRRSSSTFSSWPATFSSTRKIRKRSSSVRAEPEHPTRNARKLARVPSGPVHVEHVQKVRNADDVTAANAKHRDRKIAGLGERVGGRPADAEDLPSRL